MYLLNEIIKLKNHAARMQDKYFRFWQKRDTKITRDSYLQWQAKEQAYQNVIDLISTKKRKS